MKKNIFGVLAILLVPSCLWAACGGSSPNLTAASAGRDDVADCVAASTYGDTITIPACAAGDCVWTSGIAITKNITITGAGASGDTPTVLTVGFTDNGTEEAFLKFTPDATSRANLDSLTEDTANFEVSGIHFRWAVGYETMTLNVSPTTDWAADDVITGQTSGTTSTVVSKSTATRYIVKNCSGDYTSGEIIGVTGNAEKLADQGSGYPLMAARLSNKFGVWITNSNTPVIKRIKIHDNAYTNIHRATQVIGYVHGVFYSNTLTNTNGSYPQGAGLGAWTNDIRSVGTPQAWIIEDNTFDFPDTQGTISGAANDGGSQVVRYNTMTGTAGIYVEAHSNQSSGIKGGFFTEMYGNSFSGAAAQGVDMRGGQNMIFFNVMNDDSYQVREEFYDAYSGTLPDNWCADSNYSTGSCVGACPQIVTDSCYAWKVNRSYLFNNRRTADGAVQNFAITYDRYDNVSGHNNSPAELVENREFFNSAASFDGTVGVGCGTLAARPATCTTGVGYWATDQSCSDLTDYIGVSPTAAIAGTLYKCAATDTWEAYYTPYAYPHPLRGETTTRTITSSKVGAVGTLSYEGESIVNNGGNSQIYTAANIPNGWKVTWSGTGGCTGNGTTCQVLNVTGDVTVVATFTEIKLMPW